MAKTKKRTAKATAAAALPPKPVVASEANKSAQRKYDLLWEAALTGDPAAVEAIRTNPTSRQTYCRGHHKYKLALLVALGCPGADADQAEGKQQAE
jgi:hypothetical protein